MTDDAFSYRPYRIRIVTAVGAASVFLLFTVVGVALSGDSEVFKPGDRAAMVGLGVMFALGLLAIGRPRVRADRDGVDVRNIIGGFHLPWAAVRSVSFERGRPWLSLELENDDAVSVLAVQAVDRERAVAAVRTLRELHQRARAADVGA